MSSLLCTPARDLKRVGLRAFERADVAEAARSAARLAGFVDDRGRGEPWAWMGADHPLRVNLILEQLGRPERIDP